ncbi:hypothetical protein [Pontibacillus marinus]|uniref:Uncharacterized protein n=1 Tax=Pontibacillus marinus BH030004 = DSM 16465 TaxID=1385511 RepID=A0A0A5GL15_9BACI|nr:hypothetical protein [Pontibacillus marinus]KGX91855.1 hypothetical protein N783_00160 [Pontibacillus marinus BH030004 = DSM 16465]
MDMDSFLEDVFKKSKPQNKVSPQMNQEYKSNTYSTAVTPTIDKIITLLNNNYNNSNSINDVCSALSLSKDKVIQLLKENNYSYKELIDQWTKQSEEELLTSLVEELNRGNTLYDLSFNYFTNKKKRLNFVTNLEQLLKKEGYNYFKNLNKWEKTRIVLESYLRDLEYMPLMEVAKKYNTSDMEVRKFLKQNKYRYDSFFDTWTNQSQHEKLSKLKRDIKFNKIDLRGFLAFIKKNPEQLLSKFKEYNLDTDHSVNLIISSLEKSSNKKENTSNNVNSNQNVFSQEEIKKLRTIITMFEFNESKVDNSKSEITLLLDNGMIEDVEKLADQKEVSRSKFIQNIIEDYISNHN